MSNFDRSDRFNEEIKRGLTEIIRHEVKDPRVPELVSVTRVEAARDLSSAKVYVSAMIGEDEAKAMMKFFKDATGFLRRELGKKVILRSIPELQFIWDRNIEYGVHIADVLRSIEGDTKEKEEPGDGN